MTATAETNGRRNGGAIGRGFWGSGMEFPRRKHLPERPVGIIIVWPSKRGSTRSPILEFREPHIFRKQTRRFLEHWKAIRSLRRRCSKGGSVCKGPRPDWPRARRRQDGLGIMRQSQVLCSSSRVHSIRQEVSFGIRSIQAVRWLRNLGPIMKLIEAIRELESLDEGNTIYAEVPWTSNSEVITASEPEAGGLPLEAQKLGLRYFLEVFVAREFLEGWLSNLDAQPTLQQKCERLISYAMNDA
jgi:hypothetical protein